jgi:hypothetical protein
MDLGKFDDNISTEYFHGMGYTFNAVLFNEDGHVLRLKFGGIDELVIEDNILKWVHQGYMTLQNPHESLERSNKMFVGDSQEEETHQFHFRSDGRDYLYLHIEPLIDDEEQEKIEHEFYTIKLIFAIYKIEDLSDGNPQNKKKRLYFWDYRYQYMLEKNLRWSTSHTVKSKLSDDESSVLVSQLNDDQRSLPSGEAIRELLTYTFQDDFGDLEIDIDWNDGDNITFYSSPNEYKVVDDINYLLARHISTGETDNQACILRLERGFGHKWSLLSLTDYFRRGTLTDGKAGPYQLESFLLSYLPDSNNPIPNRPKIPQDSSTVHNVHFPDTSTITDFEFVQQPGLINQRKMVTTAVQGYDFKKKSFNVYQYGIQDAEKSFQESIVDSAYSSADSNCKANFFLNKLKIDNHNIRSINSTCSSYKDSLSIGRNQTILTGLFTGNTIQFECKGGSHRRCGRFIGIDRSNTYDENKYDDKVLGQYFVAVVSHVFTPNDYTNDIIAVKPFSFSDPGYNEDIV